MRFRHPDGGTVHLAYCTNVHAADDADGVVAQLARYSGPVRARLGVERLGVGLWLAAPAAASLARDPRAVAELRRALDRHGLEVVTLNGFPYTRFHAPVVKHAVYAPDWTRPERLAYTRDLARLLVELLPADIVDGSISTLPLAWRDPWSPSAQAAARAALEQLAADLESLAGATGRRIRVGLEPEPGCVVETTDQAARLLSEIGSPWLGVCLDCCHLAVQFEDPAEALATLAVAGVPVVKAQVSAALRAPMPDTAEGRAVLASYVEPRFLHQTRALTPGGVLAADDLDEALDGALPGEGEWRVHFHVPLHAPSGTTQAELVAALDALLGAAVPVTRHLEVETYTWTVLPPDQRLTGDDGLVEGIARELEWTCDRLTELGLAMKGHAASGSAHEQPFRSLHPTQRDPSRGV
ncbi:MAG: metabolite traffic protein EboE [Egibacteraceae bacterium]